MEEQTVQVIFRTPGLVVTSIPEYEEPEVEPFARTGYPVVEWGGMMF